MSDDHAARLAALEQLDEDLFDFPDVEKMTDLLAAARSVAAGATPAAASQKRAAGKTATAAAAQADPKAPLPVAKPSAARESTRNNATPRNADDVDEDLFGFGELFELGARGDFGAADLGASELGQDDSPLEPRQLAEPPAAPEPPKATRKKSPGEALASTAAPSPAIAPVPDKALEPKQKKSEPELRVAPEESTRGAAASQTPTARPRSSAPTKRDAEHAALGTSSPFLTFPASVDLPPARSKLLWVLVGCFLLANGGVFLMTQQQNQNVNETLIAVTSTLAEAVARGSSAASREASPYEAPVVRDAEPVREAQPMLDPANFSNTNELGLNNARRLIEQGAYAEARRNLFFILANQDRSTPLTPTLREDIDYLIALTYYDQGRSIAVEEGQ